jgi:multidrug efflux pump subunit AcrB
MGIVRFCARWPYTFYVLALLILFLGVTAFRSMPTDIFPEIDIPVVTVIWQYTGLSTPEMGQQCFPCRGSRAECAAGQRFSLLRGALF